MVGGKIIDRFTLTQDGTTLFLVKGTGSERNNTTTVRAEIPESVLNEIKIGANIWWQSGKVFLYVFEVEDVPFRKIGFSGGDARSFYEVRLDQTKIKT